MPKLTTLAANHQPGVFIDLVHVLYPEDYYCAPDVVLGHAHDALMDESLQDHINQHGPISEDADGDLIAEAIRRNVARPTDLEEAKSILSDLGLMTFARV